MPYTEHNLKNRILALAVLILVVTLSATTFAQIPQQNTPSDRIPGVTLSLSTPEKDALDSTMKDGYIRQLSEQNIGLQQQILQLQLQEIKDAERPWKANLDALVQNIKTAHKWGNDVTFDYKYSVFVQSTPPKTVTPPATTPAIHPSPTPKPAAPPPPTPKVASSAATPKR